MATIADVLDRLDALGTRLDALGTRVDTGLRDLRGLVGEVHESSLLAELRSLHGPDYAACFNVSNGYALVHLAAPKGQLLPSEYKLPFATSGKVDATYLEHDRALRLAVRIYVSEEGSA